MNKLIVIALSCLLAIAACSSSKTGESTGQYLDNSVITAKVKTALFKDEKVSATSINVKSYKGVVQLSGFVNSKAQSDRASKVAAGVTNVSEVRNHLIIKK